MYTRTHLRKISTPATFCQIICDSLDVIARTIRIYYKFNGSDIMTNIQFLTIKSQVILNMLGGKFYPGY